MVKLSEHVVHLVFVQDDVSELQHGPELGHRKVAFVPSVQLPESAAQIFPVTRQLQ